MTHNMHEYAPTAYNFVPGTQEHHVVPARHRFETFGNAGLAGFTLMEAAESEYRDVRQFMEARISDQAAAIDAIIDALDGSDVRLLDDFRPRANLAFLGPTGVGKSETAKTLAEALGNGDPHLLEIDCSDFSHGHEIARLVGSPVGYIGHDLPPMLNKELIEADGSVVLFDEIEKGSQQLFNLMLQIMDNGRLRLNNGEVVSFRNSIVILTSNLGAKEMANHLNPNKLGFRSRNQSTDPGTLTKAATHGFDESFSPEFVNRIDRKVVFHPLSEEGLTRVLDAKIGIINEQYEKIHGARLTLSEGTKVHLVQAALAEPHNGARPLIRAFEREVQTIFGRYMSAGKITEGTHVQVFHASEFNHDKQIAEPLVFASAYDENLRKAPDPVTKEIVAVSNEPVFMPPTDEESEPEDTEES